MVKLSLTPALAVLPLVAAFPGIPELNALEERKGPKAPQATLLPNGMWDNKDYILPEYRAPTHLIQRPNTGQHTNVFDAKKQYISTHGKHRFIPPGPKDRRGQCAGLNAAANHGYIHRSGISTIADAIQGLTSAYEMGVDVAAFLGILSVALEGDPITETWSIGDGIPTGLGFNSNGLYGTHNKYENDGSIMMGDAYLNGGKVSIFQKHAFDHWNKVRHMFDTNGLITFRQAAAQSDWLERFSEMNNPYYFKGPFSGVVSPAAHNLVIDLFSNHSAEVPTGTLTKEVFNSFFAVTGEKGNYKYTEGYERIPDNWYRRPAINQNSLVDIGIDLVQNNAAYPGTILRFGGNTGKTNSFTGVSIGDFSGGQFNSVEDLAKGNNFACFMLQASLAGIPDIANPLLGKAGTLLGWTLEKFAPLKGKYKCGALKMFDNSFFNQFPGSKYHPPGH